MAPFDFRVKGRPGKTGRVLVDTVRHADPRAAVEAVLGPLAWFGTPGEARGPEPAEAPGGKAASTARPWEWTDPPPGYAWHFAPGGDPNAPPEPKLIPVLAANEAGIPLRGTTPPFAAVIDGILTVPRTQETLLVMSTGLIVRVLAPPVPCTASPRRRWV